MLGFISAYDENEKSASKEKIFFVHINSSDKEDIEKEVAPIALQFARTLNLEKVYLFYGKDEKLTYEYAL